jgi:AraC-like DNA-binding protein
VFHESLTFMRGTPDHNDGQRPAHQLCLLLNKAAAFGLSPDRLLRNCKLSFSLQALQSGEIASVAQPVFSRLFEEVISNIRGAGAPEGWESMSRADFEFMCHALITSSNLLEVVERTSRFLELTGNRYGWLHLDAGADHCSISFGLGPNESCWKTFFIINAFQVFSTLHGWMIGDNIPSRYTLACPRNEEAEQIAAMFGLSVDFESSADQIIFPSEYLDRPVVRDAQDLRQLLRFYPFDTVPSPTTSTLSARVASIVRDSVVNERPMPSLNQIARRLHMAGATFRRHLATEGETLRSIRDRVRMASAYKMLATRDMHIDQVASRLGFGSAKSFNRAFVGWSGVTPATYRRRLNSSSTPPDTSVHNGIEPSGPPR